MLVVGSLNSAIYNKNNTLLLEWHLHIFDIDQAIIGDRVNETTSDF